MGPVIVGDNRPDLDTSNSTDVEPPLLRNLRERSALFEDVTTAQMVELRSVGRERRFAPGELILREGAPDPFVYVVLDGVAHVTKTTSLGDGQMRIAELHSGDVLGELKIVDPQPSSASVIAATEVTALVMDLDTFAELPTLTAVRPICSGTSDGSSRGSCARRPARAPTPCSGNSTKVGRGCMRGDLSC